VKNMGKRIFGVILVAVLAISLSGCATTRQKDMEVQGLKSQVGALETQLQQKEAEVDSLRQALSRTTEEKYNTMKLSGGAGSAELPPAKQIQQALKNAGYNVSVDGKMGKQTRNAVRDFQKANGLAADGKVGKKTWALLEQYLSKTTQ
jgi:peptidoglycan hydrolase-like protein with peptidoglycan-binding domain